MSQNEEAEKYLFVINPIAGDINKQHLPDEIIELCQDQNVGQKIFETTGDNDVENIKELIASYEPDTIVVIGGDGTVGMVSELLISKHINLGIVPQGSGNGLAKDLGIPLDYKDALDVVFKKNVIKMDVLSLNGHLSFHISDIGFNARIVERFSQKKFRGWHAYAISLFQEFFTYQPKKYKIVTPELTYEGKALLVAIANANQFGSNTKINPLGIVNDGNFEISILRQFSALDGIAVFYRLLRNRIHSSRYSQLIKCSKATIYNLDKEVFQIDGQPMENYEKIEVEIKPHCLRVIIPEKEAIQ